MFLKNAFLMILPHIFYLLVILIILIINSNLLSIKSGFIYMGYLLLTLCGTWCSFPSPGLDIERVELLQGVSGGASGEGRDYIELKSDKPYTLKCHVRVPYDDELEHVNWYKDDCFVYEWKFGGVIAVGKFLYAGGFKLAASFRWLVVFNCVGMNGDSSPKFRDMSWGAVPMDSPIL